MGDIEKNLQLIKFPLYSFQNFASCEVVLAFLSVNNNTLNDVTVIMKGTER